MAAWRTVATVAANASMVELRRLLSVEIGRKRRRPPSGPSQLRLRALSRHPRCPLFGASSLRCTGGSSVRGNSKLDLIKHLPHAAASSLEGQRQHRLQWRSWLSPPRASRSCRVASWQFSQSDWSDREPRRAEGLARVSSEDDPPRAGIRWLGDRCGGRCRSRKSAISNQVRVWVDGSHFGSQPMAPAQMWSYQRRASHRRSRPHPPSRLRARNPRWRGSHDDLFRGERRGAPLARSRNPVAASGARATRTKAWMLR